MNGSLLHLISLSLGFSRGYLLRVRKDFIIFRTWLDTNNSPAELMSVLKPSLQARSIAEPSDRDVLRRLVPHMQLFPARSSRELPASQDKICLWNASVTGFQLPIGSPVFPDLLAKIPSSVSLRLFVVDKDIWNTAFQPQSDLPLPEPSFSVADDDESHRYSDIISPLSDTSEDSIGLKSVNDATGDDFIFRGKRIPVVVEPVTSRK